LKDVNVNLTMQVLRSLNSRHVQSAKRWRSLSTRYESY